MMCRNVILLSAFFILAPVISIGGHEIMPQEFFLYGYIVFHLIKNNSKLVLSHQSKFFLYYFLAFVFMLIVVTIISFIPYTKYDIYMSRQILQLFIASVLFSEVFSKIKYGNLYNFEKCIYTSFYILSIPSLVVYFQIYDIFGLRDSLMSLYQPYLKEIMYGNTLSYRAASVFKGFFTFSVYMIILNATMFYWYLISKRSFLERNGLLILFIFNFATQLYVARTSLLFIPIAVMLMFPIIMKHRLFLKRYLQATLVFMAGLIVILLTINPEKFAWAMEVINIFSPSYEKFSSVADMSTMNNEFYQHLKEHPSMIFVPYHEYLVSYREHTFYTDNFYLQEISRYGLYGLILYFSFHFTALLFLYKRKTLLFIFVIVLMILNYKGGNTLFMTKNIYMYAFLASLLLKIEPLMFDKINKKFMTKKKL